MVETTPAFRCSNRSLDRHPRWTAGPFYQARAWVRHHSLHRQPTGSKVRTPGMSAKSGRWHYPREDCLNRPQSRNRHRFDAQLPPVRTSEYCCLFVRTSDFCRSPFINLRPSDFCGSLFVNLRLRVGQSPVPRSAIFRTWNARQQAVPRRLDFCLFSRSREAILRENVFFLDSKIPSPRSTPGRGGRAVLEPFGYDNLASPSRVREGRPRSGRGGFSEPAMDSTTSTAAALSGPSARLSQRESEAKVRKWNNFKAARPPREREG